MLAAVCTPRQPRNGAPRVGVPVGRTKTRKGGHPIAAVGVPDLLGHVLRIACGFNEADVTLNQHIPGDVVGQTEISGAKLQISAEIAKGEIHEVRVFAGADIIWKQNPHQKKIELEFTLPELRNIPFIRVEAEGENPELIMVSTPFFLE